jgi:sulfur-oxidizing protein SoxY
MRTDSYYGVRDQRQGAGMTALFHKALRSVLALLLCVPLMTTRAATPAERSPQPTDDPAASAIWLKVQASLFEKRTLLPAPAGLLTLEAPVRAIDAAVVPVALRTKLPANAGYTISKLYLIIDSNPSPISGIFTFAPGAGPADIETRVRIDGYSWLRAIAETSDGKLFMTHRFVKASGGCSAPPGSDPAAALATMGQMKLRVEGDVNGKEPVLAQLAIQHPNHTGLAMDQYTREFTPAHYVRKIDVTYAGKPLLSADVDFSMSENPHFRFYFAPQGGKGEADLRATVVDSKDMRFVSNQPPRGTPQ